MPWVAPQVSRHAPALAASYTPISHHPRKRIAPCAYARLMPQNSPAMQLPATCGTHPHIRDALEFSARHMPGGQTLLPEQSRICALQPGEGVARPGSPQSSRQQTRDDFSFCPHPQSSSRGSIDARLWAANHADLQTPQLAAGVRLWDLNNRLRVCLKGHGAV